MDSDLSSISSELSEAKVRERNQQKHYQLLTELQSMANQLPHELQQRMPYELLSDLASVLIDDTVGKIVEGLKDIQHMTEKDLYDKRQKLVDERRRKRFDLVKRLRSEVAVGLVTKDQAKRTEESFDEETEKELKRFDVQVISELDQAVSEQQVTLEKTSVPGFHVTNNASHIRLQMHLLDFILKCSSRNKRIPKSGET